MGRHSNYQSGKFFDEIEKLNKKLDKLITTNSELNLTIYNLRLEIKSLTKQLDEANETIKKLQKDNDRLKNQINKNSSNSSKPSSSNFTTPKKKTSANEYNYRVKSTNKVGGQIGHEGHNLSKKDIEALIDKKKIKVKIIKHNIKGKTGDEPMIKYRMGVEINTYVEKHLFIPNENSNDVLPKEFYTDVTYDNNIKALSIELGTYNLVTYDRLSDFFNVITDGILNISNGTLVNFLREFSNKSKASLDNLEYDILNSKNIHTDETGTKFNKKNMYVRNYSNEKSVIYKAHKSKGHKPILEDNILPKFCGRIMVDHDTTLYSYGSKNYEYNIHIGRYLEEIIQNVPNTLWEVKMKDLIFRMYNTKNISISYGLKGFNKEKVKEYEAEYDNILKLAKEENKNIRWI